MTPRTLRRYGNHAWLMECEPSDVAGLVLSADQSSPSGVIDVVPGAQSILATFDPVATDETTVAHWLRALPVSIAPLTAAPLVELEVTYNGPDLAEVAAACDMSPAEVVARHVAGDYVVAFCGFAPGFAYLTGIDPTLQLARHSAPRESVPAGSVAIAADYSAVYPRSSPGGWHLIGSCDAVLFDADREPPALLTPGTRVKFREVDQ